MESLNMIVFFLVWMAALSALVLVARFLIDRQLGKCSEEFFKKMENMFRVFQWTLEKGETGTKPDGAGRKGKTDLA